MPSLSSRITPCRAHLNSRLRALLCSPYSVMRHNTISRAFAFIVAGISCQMMYVTEQIMSEDIRISHQPSGILSQQTLALITLNSPCAGSAVSD